VARTAAEKIVGRHAGRDVVAGDLVIAAVDVVMATDGNAPLAIRLLREELGADDSFDGSKVILVIDHCAPAPNEGAANLQATMREFAAASGAKLYDAGAGISHVVLPEEGDVGPGMLVVGSDSHTVTYGAVNCLGTGMGSTDVAVAMRTGRVWLRVPETIRVDLEGELQAGATAKDVTLELVRSLGVDGATYRCLEFGGEGLATLTMDNRFTLANMSMEMGAKCALFPVDPVCDEYLRERLDDVPEQVWSDPGCLYEQRVTLDLSEVVPLVARPHDLMEIDAVETVGDQPIDLAFIGTCTNGRLSDLEQAAEVLRGKRVSPSVRLIVTPGSRRVYLEALRLGLIEAFVEAGAIVTPPGCGPCVGTHQGIPGDGDVVITTANRNFQGRMGNRRASIFVGSPETVAASAVLGRIGRLAEVAA
jgi:3-isopropylmalate/(R)-2-methylmalate dehydratase large subunit